MLAAQGTAQNINSMALGVLLLATALVVFWRPVIKLMIMTLVIGVITGLGIGVVVLLQSMHHIIR
jgi:hypothetical protein